MASIVHIIYGRSSDNWNCEIKIESVKILIFTCISSTPDNKRNKKRLHGHVLFSNCSFLGITTKYLNSKRTKLFRCQPNEIIFNVCDMEIRQIDNFCSDKSLTEPSKRKFHREWLKIFDLQEEKRGCAV